jgi:phosphoglycerol transferase MdoB-like AlkP superfamily enzyme
VNELHKKDKIGHVKSWLKFPKYMIYSLNKVVRRIKVMKRYRDFLFLVFTIVFITVISTISTFTNPANWLLYRTLLTALPIYFTIPIVLAVIAAIYFTLRFIWREMRKVDEKKERTDCTLSPK